jgi:hypothetical protein
MSLFVGSSVIEAGASGFTIEKTLRIAFGTVHCVMAAFLDDPAKRILYLFRQMPEYLAGRLLGGEPKRVVVAVPVKF